MSGVVKPGALTLFKSLKPGKILAYAILITGGLVMTYPLLFALFSSVSTVAEYRKAVIIPIPLNAMANLQNFAMVFKVKSIYRAVIVTLLKIAVNTVFVVFTSVLCGYAFSMLNFTLKRSLFLILISGMMIPGVAMMVPNFVWMAKFPLVGGNDILGRGGSGFIDNPMLLFITGNISAYNIFLCRQSLISLGGEIGESAKIDGASYIRIVFLIYMPLIKPIISVMFLNIFVASWNNYMTSLVYLSGVPEWNTVGKIFSDFVEHYANPGIFGGADYPKSFAVAIIAMTPPLIVFVFVQKSFIEGLSMGAVKG
jgi:multiple sugar transport system permease protein